MLCVFLEGYKMHDTANLDMKTVKNKKPENFKIALCCNTLALQSISTLNSFMVKLLRLILPPVLAALFLQGQKFEKNGVEEYQKWIRRLRAHVWVAAAPAERRGELKHRLRWIMQL